MTYLIARTYDFWRRQRRSLEHIPYPPRDLPIPHPEHTPPDRARGLLIGIAIGDALGLARESIPPKLAQLRWPKPLQYSRGILRFMRLPGIISDDTQHTLIIAHALTPDGQFDESRARQDIIDWYSMRVGPGKATQDTVAKMRKGIEDAADKTSQGNGGAMRVAPLAIVAKHQQHLEALCAQSASITHAEPEAIEGAKLMGTLFRWCLDHQLDQLNADNLLPQLKPSSQSQEPGLWHMRLKQIRQCLNDTDTTPVAHIKALGTSGWVYHTCASVWFMVLYYKDRWRDALVDLYEVGGDTDTIGALYCAAIGALCGQRIFDDAQLQRTQGMHLVIEQADRLMGLSHDDNRRL